MAALNFPLVELYELLLRGLFGFCRIGAFVALMPMFGSANVPTRVRLVLALAITLAAWPFLPETPDYQEFSLRLFLDVAQQVMLGLMLGFPTLLFFHVFVMAAQLIALQMGLGFASMVDPDHGVSVTVLGQFYLLLVSLLFLALDGHLVIIQVAIESFRFWPEIPWSSTWALVQMGTFMFSAALLVALPAITALLVVNLALGVLTRAAPQLNIFSIGFPLSLLVGVLVVWMSSAGLLPQYSTLSTHFFELYDDLLQQP